MKTSWCEIPPTLPSNLSLNFAFIRAGRTRSFYEFLSIFFIILNSILITSKGNWSTVETAEVSDKLDKMCEKLKRPATEGYSSTDTTVVWSNFVFHFRHYPFRQPNWSRSLHLFTCLISDVKVSPPLSDGTQRKFLHLSEYVMNPKT